MTTAQERYDQHLAPTYVWMAGGCDAVLQAGAMELEALGLPLARGDFVLDRGAGFGMHAIPLARSMVGLVAQRL